MNAFGQYISVLDEGIRSCLDLIHDGYEYSGVKEAATLALGRYLEAQYVHPYTHRKITIADFPEPTDPRAKEALCVHVTKNAENPYSGTFIVDDFLKQNGADAAELRALHLSAYTGSARERVKGVLAKVATILRSDLKDVVAGSQWVDVPFDWGDYK